MTLRFKQIFDFLLRRFPTEQHCIDYLEKVIWNNNPISPFNPNSKVYKCKGNRYKCKATNKYFNIKTRTVFENTKLPLQSWFYALYVYDRKKGISSLELVEELGITQKTAWFILHRLRKTSDCSLFKEMLKDFVEIDETFIGGKNGNRHKNKKVPQCQGRSWADKTPVLGMIERNGNLICQVVRDTKRKTIEPIIKEHVTKGSNVYTDEWFAYQDLRKWYNHGIVNHRIRQYVNGEATTNRIENSWSHLKRTIYGTYHWISKKHLPKYVDEFTFRFNARKHSSEERFDLMLLSAVGKRLTYQQLIA